MSSNYTHEYSGCDLKLVRTIEASSVSISMQALSQLLSDYHSKGVETILDFSMEEPTDKDRNSMISVIRQFVLEKEKDHSSHEMEAVQVVEDMTDHLMRCMAIPSVRSNLSDLLEVIIASRIVVRNTHAKNIFSAFGLLYKLMEQYQDPMFHLECWKLTYNVCMDEDQKDMFIRTGGMVAMKHTILLFIDHHELMAEICDFSCLLSIGKKAPYRMSSLYEHGLIYRVLAILVHFRDDAEIVEKAFVSLRYLLLSYSNEEVAVENGAQELMCELIFRHSNPDIRKKGIVVLKNLFSQESSHKTLVPIVSVVMELFRQATQKEEVDQLVLFVGNLSCWHSRESNIHFSINDFIPSTIACGFVQQQEKNWIPITDEQLDNMYQRFMGLVERTKPSAFYDFQNNELDIEVVSNPHKTTRRSYLYFHGHNGMSRIPRALSLPFQTLAEYGSFAPFASGNDTEKAEDPKLEAIEEEISIDVPDLSECKTITDVLIKVLNTADEKRSVRIFYVVRLAVKTQVVAEDLVRLGLLSMLVNPTFSRNKRVARNACAALYALAANSSEASLMPVEEMKGFTIDDGVLLDFISKLGSANQIQKETAIRVLILCGFSFSKSVFSQFPSLSSFYQEIQEKMTKKNTEFMAQINSSPVDVLGVVAEYLNFSNNIDQ